MTTFVDTAALYALLDEDDRNHAAAATWFSQSARDPDELLVTHDYIVVESAALVQRRLGADAVGVLFEAFLPTMSIEFVDEDLFRRAAARYRSNLGRRSSLVDFVSFELMQDEGVDRAFTFDDDFERAGFTLVPDHTESST